jgi:prepilin-type processing-associated H-X9-DG protein
MNNLKQIGLALHMYSQDNNENFPDDISALYPNYVGDMRIFICPSSKVSSDTQISYVYIRGLSEQDSSDSIIAYDASPDNHDGDGRNVLFLDGHVRWCTEKEFQKLLNKSIQSYSSDF